MIGENNYPSHKWRLLLWTMFLLLLIVGGSIAVFEVSQGKIVHDNRGVVSVATPKHTPTTTLTPPQPLFFDDFLDNSKGWSVSNIAGYTRTVENGKLTLTATNHKILIESLPTSTIFNDFSLTTTFTLLQADEHDSVGLYVRGDSNLDHDYRIDIFGNSEYAVSKESLDLHNNDISTPLISPIHSDVLKPVGQQNSLSVMMKESTLLLILNGTMVNTMTDVDYTHGQIALFVENSATSDGVSAIFSDITIYPAPDQLPAFPNSSGDLPHPPPPGVAMVKRSPGNARK